MASITWEAKIFAMSVTSVYTSFMMYHYGSYASNPVMLRTNKPLIMRDIFLTKCKSFFPNPFSCVYIIGWQDTILNCLAVWFCTLPVASVIGPKHATYVLLGSGFMSSFAYIFQNQINPRKRATEYDCTATSNGAVAGLCALSFLIPKCYIPLSKRTPAAFVGGAWITKCLYDEYVYPNCFQKRREDIEVTNWGVIGGVFFALMYSSLVLRTKVDFRAMSTFYTNIAKKQGLKV